MYHVDYVTGENRDDTNTGEIIHTQCKRHWRA